MMRLGARGSSGTVHAMTILRGLAIPEIAEIVVEILAEVR
jgi:hypothetical protein